MKWSLIILDEFLHVDTVHFFDFKIKMNAIKKNVGNSN